MIGGQRWSLEPSLGKTEREGDLAMGPALHGAEAHLPIHMCWVLHRCDGISCSTCFFCLSEGMVEP